VTFRRHPAGNHQLEDEMAYDRYDPRGGRRDDRSRSSSERDRFHDRGRDDERGFFERAGDEISSWFGDEDAERRRERDRHMDEGPAGSAHYGRDQGREDYWRDRSRGTRDHDRDRGDLRSERGMFGGRGSYRGTSGDSGSFGATSGSFRDERQYRPMTGNYGGEGYFAGNSVYEESAPRSRSMDPHYHSWRSRQIDEFDRDYEDYRRENQAKFEDDFSNWRQRRSAKRGLLGQIREHMDVVGSDEEHVGKVDRVSGDRVILAKSDPESGGVHHSLSCSDIDRVEGDRVILDCSSEDARKRWRDESRNRALFEREDQGEIGPRVLDRSFEGTYR
jgi:hypothetical protein